MNEFIMSLFNTASPLYQIIVAAFLGVFIGLRSEAEVFEVRKKKKGVGVNITGVRTMSLLVVLGTLSTFFSEIPYLSLILFIGVLAFLLIAYSNGVFRLQRYGLTAEISALLAYLIGVLIGYEQITLAILLSVLLGVSAAYKVYIRDFASHLSLAEWSGALQLLVISALILPILPREAIDSFGVFVPFDIWVLVIVISAIGFIGYFFGKYTGERKSIIITSFLGALVSSTATTTALARRAKLRGANTGMLLSGVMIAISVMQVRVLVEIVALTHRVEASFIAPACAMLATSIGCAIYYHITTRERGKKRIKKIATSSPFELLPALSFALFFVVVLYAIYFGQKFFGDVGAYVTAFIASFADVDVIVFSTLLSYQKNLVDMTFVANILAIAVIINTLVKLFYILTFGTRQFFMHAIAPMVLVVGSGIIAAFLV